MKAKFVVKRIIDIIAATLGLLILSPILIIVAIIISRRM